MNLITLFTTQHSILDQSRRDKYVCLNVKHILDTKINEL